MNEIHRRSAIAALLLAAAGVNSGRITQQRPMPQQVTVHVDASDNVEAIVSDKSFGGHVKSLQKFAL